MERILVERKVRAHPVVVGRVIRQQMTEVPFPQPHDVVKAFASDRADHATRTVAKRACRIDLRRQSGLSHQSLDLEVFIGTTFGWHNR